MGLCREAYKQYLGNPTESLKAKLKETYEKVPKHERRYVGNMDVKDIEIRMILYGEREIDSWSHYQVSKEIGLETPKNDISRTKGT